MKKSSKSKKKDTKSKRDWLVIAMISFGCFLVLIDFFSPPPGEVHAETTALFGKCLAFVAAVLGINFVSKKID